MKQDATQFANDADVSEFRQLLEHNRVQLGRRKRLALIALTVLALVVLALFLLSDQGPLHSRWAVLGKPAIILFDGSLLFAVVACGFWWSEWKLRREVRRDVRELVEDRYEELPDSREPPIDKAVPRRIRIEIHGVLLNVWDPIGIKNEPNAQNEYDEYIGQVYELLVASAPDSKIAEYLHWVAHDRMGFDNAQIEDMTETVSALRQITLT